MQSKQMKEAVAGHRQRIREKYAQNGLDTFADYELLELLLTYAIPRRDVKPLAKALLNQYRSFCNLIDAPLEELEKIPGLGKNSALLFKIVRGAAVRYLEQNIANAPYLSAAEKFADYARMKLGELTDEVLMVFYLNTQNFLLGSEILCQGTTDRVSVFPAVIAKNALLKGARSVVICHNHPGGSVIPSGEDNIVTLDIKRALKAIDVILLDHIIVSKFEYHSYRQADQECSSRVGCILDPLE